LPTENDSNDDFEDSGIFDRKLVERLEEEIDAIFQKIRNEGIEGTWEAEIDEPNVKWWISMSRLGSDHALEPLDPLKPRRKRPMPERPFELPKNAIEEVREPLTDVFDEENTITVYMELPGEDKDNIQMKVKDDKLQVKTRRFQKTRVANR